MPPALAHHVMERSGGASHTPAPALQETAHSVRAAPYGLEHMFQSSKTRLRVWLALAEDLLGDAPADADLDFEAWATHPHRRPLHWRRERRAGSVPPPAAHCLCPVRNTTAPAGDRSEVMPNR